MSGLTRRQLLRGLAGCVTSAGTVVLARTVLAGGEEAPTATPAGPDERADRLAGELPAPPEGAELVSFANRAFRNGGGFRNGAFRNGGFANGGFRNGAFRNW
jgi:hypothetical protein